MPSRSPLSDWVRAQEPKQKRHLHARKRSNSNEFSNSDFGFPKQNKNGKVKIVNGPDRLKGSGFPASTPNRRYIDDIIASAACSHDSAQAASNFRILISDSEKGYKWRGQVRKLARSQKGFWVHSNNPLIEATLMTLSFPAYNSIFIIYEKRSDGAQMHTLQNLFICSS
jgi:hypothetical protein